LGQWLPPPDQGPKPIKKSAIQHGLVNGSDIVGWNGVAGFNLELAEDGSLREYGVL
jgi:hypothetical protein